MKRKEKEINFQFSFEILLEACGEASTSNPISPFNSPLIFYKARRNPLSLKGRGFQFSFEILLLHCPPKSLASSVFQFSFEILQK